MSGVTNWSEALAHPCFWSLHYSPLLYNNDNMDKLEAVFGCSGEQSEEFFRLLHGDRDAEIPLPPDADDADDNYAEYELEAPATSVLTLSFPENYTWALEFFDGEVIHKIYHPQKYSRGLVVAVDGGNSFLPGLRWAEVKQMVACLQPTWPGPFDLQALYLLLYLIANPVTPDEYEEVRQTLGTAWKALQVVKPSQLEGLLDASIGVFEQSPAFRHFEEQGWELPASVGPEQLWFPDPSGYWFCISWNSLRRKGDHEGFTPFFDMLERHTQPPT